MSPLISTLGLFNVFADHGIDFHPRSMEPYHTGGLCIAYVHMGTPLTFSKVKSYRGLVTERFFHVSTHNDGKSFSPVAISEFKILKKSWWLGLPLLP